LKKNFEMNSDYAILSIGKLSAGALWRTQVTGGEPDLQSALKTSIQKGERDGSSEKSSTGKEGSSQEGSSKSTGEKSSSQEGKVKELRLHLLQGRSRVSEAAF
jgi:hypothetical protein